MPQTHQPGAEAEVDFADLWIVLRGVKTKVFLFTLRLSFSGKAMHRAFASQGQEAVLEGREPDHDGHVRVHVEVVNAAAGLTVLVEGQGSKSPTRDRSAATDGPRRPSGAAASGSRGPRSAAVRSSRPSVAGPPDLELDLDHAADARRHDQLPVTAVEVAVWSAVQCDAPDPEPLVVYLQGRQADALDALLGGEPVVQVHRLLVVQQA